MKRFAVGALALFVVAGACSKKSETPANLNAANKVSMRQVRLYYESPRMLLAAEGRNIALPESPAAAMPMVVRELMKGPAAGSPLGGLFPADTVVRGAYLLPGGTVIVDLGGTTLTQGWGTGSHQELLAGPDPDGELRGRAAGAGADQRHPGRDAGGACLAGEVARAVSRSGRTGVTVR